MTLEAMQEHESVTLHYGPTDYRRVGIVQLLARFVSGRRILDMRSLNGELLHILRHKGADVCGLDGYAEAVESCNNRFKQDKGLEPVCFEWDLVHLPAEVAKREYDSVVCADLLNHVPSDKATLELIHRILNPRGQLLLVVPAFSFLEGERDRSLGHLRRYTKQQITTLLNTTGYEVHHCRYWNFLALFPYILVEKLLRFPLSDRVRYSGAEPDNAVWGPLLRWWYVNVENRIPLPIGLSLVVNATKVT